MNYLVNIRPVFQKVDECISYKTFLLHVVRKHDRHAQRQKGQANTDHQPFCGQSTKRFSLLILTLERNVIISFYLDRLFKLSWGERFVLKFIGYKDSLSTIYNTIPSFHNQEDKCLENIVGKIKENAGNQGFLLFPQCFLSLYNLHYCARFNLSANTLDLNKSKIFLYGKKLKHTKLLTLSQTSPQVLRVCSTSLLKSQREKEKLLITSNFSFLPQCFPPVWRTFCYFHQTQNCCLQNCCLSVWKGLKSVVPRKC